MLNAMKNDAITEKKYNELSDEEKVGKLPRGIFVEQQEPEFTKAYNGLVQSLQKPEEDKK